MRQRLLVILAIVALSQLPFSAGAYSPKGSGQGDALTPASCQTTNFSNGGVTICPKSQGLPPEFAAHIKRPVQVQDSIQAGSESDALYWCDWGETCYGVVLLGEGVAYDHWYAEFEPNGQVYSVAQFTAECTDPTGC